MGLHGSARTENERQGLPFLRRYANVEQAPPRIPPQDAPFGNGGFEHGLGFFGTIEQRGPTCATSEPAGETLVYDPSDPPSTRTVCQVRAGVSKHNGIDG